MLIIYSFLLPWKVRYLNTQSITIVHNLLKKNEPKSDVGRCQLFLCLLRSRSLVVVRRKLGRKTLKNTESISHIVKSIVKAFTSIGKKIHSQDCNVACHVLAESIVSISTIQCYLMKYTSQIVNLHPKTLKIYSIRRDSFDMEGEMNRL
jgi:hypothetical protein